MTGDALFNDTGLRVEPEELTAGQRLRARQAERIRLGHHPLSIWFAIPLHPDAPRDAHPDDDRDYPRCGTCVSRRMVGGHARSFPKCMHRHDGHRLDSSSVASDVRAWWPACVHYAPREAS